MMDFHDLKVVLGVFDDTDPIYDTSEATGITFTALRWKLSLSCVA
jgi:hypothetical protein